MKFLKIISLGIVLVSGYYVQASDDETNYFRVWQGFKRAEFSSAEFLSELPQFMKDTVDIYTDLYTFGVMPLNNYIVVVPPQNKPDFIPDELALVALNSEQDYRKIRKTQEGQWYSDRHWDLFQKGVSKSVDPLINYAQEKPSELFHQYSYDMIGKPINWSNGFNAVFIGLRKTSVSQKEFLIHLRKHVELAKTVMVPKGLRGYVVIADKNYEIAYLNWSSKEVHDQAGKSHEGEAVFTDAGSFMDVLMYQEAVPFQAGKSISFGQAYSTLQ